MPRVKGSVQTRNRRKKVLKLAKGYFGSKHILFKTANEQVMHSMKYAYRDRRQLKRDMRKLWITRINAASRMNDISYSQLMYGLKLANINVNRKMLSEIAIHDAKGFTSIVNSAKKAIEKGPAVVKEEVVAEKKVDAEVAVQVVETPVVEVKKAAPKKATTAKKTAPKTEKKDGAAEKKTAVKKPAAKKPAAKKTTKAE